MSIGKVLSAPPGYLVYGPLGVQLARELRTADEKGVDAGGDERLLEVLQRLLPRAHHHEVHLAARGGNMEEKMWGGGGVVS